MEEIRKSIRNLVRLNKISALIYSFIVPVMVGVFAAYHHELNTVNPLLFWIPVVLLIGLALVFAWFTFDIKLAPEYYLELQDAEETNSRLSKNIYYWTLLQEHILTWNVIARTYLSQRITNDTECKDMVAKFIFPVVQNRAEYFGCGGSELWNFAIYLWKDGQKCLVPIWRMKHPKHPSTGFGRKWLDGEGHVGHAYHGRIPIITPDANLDFSNGRSASGLRL